MTLTLLACAFAGRAAAAGPRAVLSIGASEDAGAVHLGFQLPFEPPLQFLRSERISTNADFLLGYWRGRSPDMVNHRLVDVALLPVVRFHPNGARERGFFLEAGIGAHLLSRTRIHGDRRFGSAFQFGDLLGMGWRLGPGGDHEVGLRIQHVSNGGIKPPNDGINFLEFRFVAPL